MKKYLQIFFVPLVLAALLVCLGGCQEKTHAEHVHQLIIDKAVEPSCDTSGCTEGRRCRICGEVMQQQLIIPALGHSYEVDWTIDRPATDTTDGEKSRHCTVCDTRLAITTIPRLVPPTEGLTFELNEDETGFVCTGFAAGKNAAELHIPSTYLGMAVTEIAPRAFEGNTTITSLTIPSSITFIGKSAFGSCTRLAKIDLPDTVKYIADGAFKSTAAYGNSSLWLDGMFYIGNHLIEVRSNVAKGNYVVREGTVTIGGTAFFNCTGLTTVTIPEGVVSIGNSAFYGCSALRQVYLPDSLEIIGNGALAYCTSLVEFRLPKNVHSILSNPFPGSTALQRIEVDKQNLRFHSNGNCLIETDTGTLAIGCVASVIPSDGSVTKIGTAAFYECGSLVSLTIPEGVEEIGISAFYGCTNLIEISLPHTLNVIGRQAFRNCEKLAEIVVPVGVERLDEGAFCYCYALERVSLPEGLISIDANTFAYCKSLKELNLPNSLRYIGAASLAQCNLLEFEEYGNCLYLGNWLVGALNTEITSASLKPTTVGIGPSAFSGCHNLTDITLPSSLAFIGSNAFFNCYKLTELVIPEGITEINTRTFAGCTWLKDLHLPSTLTSIAGEALLDCTSLERLHYAGTARDWVSVVTTNGWDKNAGNYTLVLQ